VYLCWQNCIIRSTASDSHQHKHCATTSDMAAVEQSETNLVNESLAPFTFRYPTILQASVITRDLCFFSLLASLPFLSGY
jgi:hypothetical protein